MAEVVGVVASGAGLASLTIQLVELAQRLRKRFENLNDLQDTVKDVLDDVESNNKLLQEIDFACVRDIQTGPVVLEKCRLRGLNVVRKLENLLQSLTHYSSESSLRRGLSIAFKLEAWKTKVAELKRAVADFKLDILMLLCLLSLRKCDLISRPLEAPKPTSNPENENPPQKAESSITEDDKSIPIPQSAIVLNKKLRASYCTVKHCPCSCHSFKQMQGRFWFLKYTPITSFSTACDNASCTTHRYEIDFRFALSRLGIYWAVVLGLSLDEEAGRYQLKPSLSWRRVVKDTAPGFDTLFLLSERSIGWEVAKKRFNALYQSDPGFVKQVDRKGRGFLEKTLQYGSWEYPNCYDFETQHQLLTYFCEEFGLSRHVDAVEVLYGCSRDMAPALILEKLVGIGFDFSDVPSPSFEHWPEPDLGDIGPGWPISLISDDPFFLKLIKILTLSNQDFGGTTQLQAAILHCDLSTCQSLIRKRSPLEKNVNFRGQTPLHIATETPNLLKLLLDSGHNINTRDKYGATPLMYAAAFGNRDSVSILIRQGADLFIKDNLENSDFLDYAAMRLHWSLIWHIVDEVETRDTNLLQPLLSRVKSIPGPARYTEEGEKYFEDFWMTMLTKSNMYFDDGSTFLHIAPPPLAKTLISGLDFDEGEHILFPYVHFLDSSLLKLCVDNGALMDTRNNKGMTALHVLFDEFGGQDTERIKSALNCLDTFLDSGANVEISDNCNCRCSSYGCLPASDLELQATFMFRHMVHNPFWIFEWLHMLEERGQVSQAKNYATAAIRRSKFNAAGLTHNCHHYVDDIPQRDDDAFWDIESQIKLDRLDSDMCIAEMTSYEEVKASLVREIQNNSERDQLKEDEERSSLPNKAKSNDMEFLISKGRTEPELGGCVIDYNGDNLYSKLDVCLMGGMCQLMGTIAESISAQEGIKMCFSDFVTTL